MTLRRENAEMMTGACCDCILCIPGLCACLSTSGVVDISAELKLFDAQLADETSHELDKGESASGGIHFWRAVGTGIRDIEEQPRATFATGVHLATHVRANAPAGLPAVGLSVALLALRRLLPLVDDSELDSGWGKRVRGAAKSPAFVDELCALLLELDDGAAKAMQADVQSRDVPVWQKMQAAAWLAEARPAWRARARQGRNGAPLTPAALAGVMHSLLLSLSSVHEPLLVKSDKVHSSGFASVRLCSPRCPCAAGGCRATGVQYPMQLRSAGEGSIGLGGFATTFIPGGALVGPYVGEVTSAAAADAQSRASTSGHFYALDLEAEAWARLRTPAGSAAVVDGSHFSNTIRFLNHSCKPNLGRAAVDWPGLEAGPLVALYALEDIQAGTELTWVRCIGTACALLARTHALYAPVWAGLLQRRPPQHGLRVQLPQVRRLAPAGTARARQAARALLNNRGAFA